MIAINAAELLQSSKMSWGDFRLHYIERATTQARFTRNHALNVLSDIEEILAPERLDELTAERLAYFKRALLAKGNKPNTIASKMKQFNGILRWAMHAGIVAAAPIAPDAIHESDADGTSVAGLNWTEFRRRHSREVLASLAVATRQRYATIFDEIEKYLAPDCPADLTAARLSHFQARLREQGNEEVTIRSKLAHTKAALKWGERMGMIEAAPMIVMPKRARGARFMKGRPLNDDEVGRMLAATADVVGRERAPFWRHYLRGLWLSGLRLTESLELFWDGVEGLRVMLDERRPLLLITAEFDKGNQDRLLPMAPEFAEFLVATPEHLRTGRVFQLKAARVCGERMLHWQVGRTVSKIGKAAGIVVNKSRGGKLKYASAHDLRRAFGRRWSSRVKPIVLMRLMRHANIETTLRYYAGDDAMQTADVLWAAHTGESADDE